MPWTPTGSHPEELVYFATPDNRPPKPGCPLVLVEGEKTADAVAAAGYVAAGTVCGASAQPGETVIRLLSQYRLTLSPDNDEVGFRHMEQIAERLEWVEVADCRWIDPPSGAPQHWDLADVSGPERRRLIEGAHAVQRSTSGPRPSEGAVPRVGIDAADLLTLDLPPLRWIIPDVLPEGMTILAAPPKVGKSCLVYQVAVECAIGGTVLGRQVTPGCVLYLALEDGERRGQDRLHAALAGRTMPRGRLEIRWSSRNIGEGLEDDIAAWLDTHPDAVIVAIDTLGRVRPRTDGKRNAYEVDVHALARLQALFRDRRVALVIVHHARKEAADDFLASVSGTYGITGSADTIVVVKRKRLETFGTLLVTGRDVPDAELAVRFDGFVWHAAPEALPTASAQQAEVYRVIESVGPIWPKAIADQLGMERTSVQHIVERLVDSGAVARTVSGYVAALTPSSSTSL